GRSSPTLIFERDAFQKFFDDGILSIAAAGNGGDSSYFYPASHSSVMSVAATDINNAKAWFSQYNDEIDIAAPGVDIKSTVGPPSYTGVGPPGYGSKSGTSMAAPHVSGLAMVLWNKYPSYTNADIRTALEQGAEDLGEPGIDDYYGHGLANYQGAEMRLFTPSPPQTPPPSLPPSLPACPLGDVCTTGPCLITDGGSCATSPDFPNDYPVNEGCTLYGLPPVGLDVIAFDVEAATWPYDCRYDHLVVNGVKYCGTSGPAGVVPSDGTMTW
ncbi:hypothetical protein EMIHUDRAFT_124541, partial [Emiliania huxleyi CCMP1516]|uniref:Peptidase S8/S53 domain-containing protein n=2 Tax=Emiliania huxleyi TaxID=2903 RepID=A0A0D3INB1_EMIH1